MKTRLVVFCTVAFALLSASAPASQTLLTDPILIGTLTIRDGNGNGGPKKVALTKRYLLDYFGFPNVKPADTAFYLNSDQASATLLSLCSKDGVVTWGTVLRYDQTAETDFGTIKRNESVYFDQAQSLSDDVMGGMIIHVLDYHLNGRGALKATFQFTGAGALSGSSTTNGLLQLQFTGILLAPK